MASSVAVIGAGSSGIAACQVLRARGIPFDCFEKGSEVGGNWRYMNDNEMSAAYKSLHINTSRRLMSYASYPMPEHLPDFPSHWEIARYFDDFVDHFGLRDQIRFRTEVTKVEPVAAGEGSGNGSGPARYRVHWRTRDGQESSAVYAQVLVASGHHWDPRWPEPAFPGQDGFRGTLMHAHDYKTYDVLEGKRVLVLGIGNSAVDIAVESSRTAEATFLAMRRGAWVVPKFLKDQPVDQITKPWVTRLPLRVQRVFYKWALRDVAGDMTAYGLPEPDHEILEAHPTASAELLPRLGHGDIAVKPNIERFEGDRVVFADGSTERIDVVVFCTGYKITFPFFDPKFVSAPDNRLDLYRRVVDPGHPGLYFLGFLQPLGAIMPLAEAQAEWIADLIDGTAGLPSPERMRREIEREQERMARRYVASKRHTIQVDFHPYLRSLKRERRAGRRRGGGNGAAGASPHAGPSDPAAERELTRA
ncbi:MAG: flavin-containing monooxygenase [Solirubrobacterales bacterium]